MREGKEIALISDAGTPCINDPGQILVNACLEAGIAVTSIPGPCSVINALILSGLSFEKFQFIGFLPKKPTKTLQKALFFKGATVCFESPNRLLSTLKDIVKIDPSIELAAIKEMTKKFEKIYRGRAHELLELFANSEIKGEFVLVFKEHPIEETDLSAEEMVEALQEMLGLSAKEAIKACAKLLHKKKSDIYRTVKKI